MTPTRDILATEPHIPLSRLRDMAKDFQARATAMRKTADADDVQADSFALGLDAAAADLFDECRRMEDDVHIPIREDEANCGCADNGNPESCECPCHAPLELVGRVRRAPTLDEFLTGAALDCLEGR